MADTKSGIPQHEIEILARHFLPQIRAFFATEEGRKEFEEWRTDQAAIIAQNIDKTT